MVLTNLLLLSRKVGKHLLSRSKSLGECTIRYGGNDKPILPCARVVIETEAPYEIVKPADYMEADLT